MVTVMWIGLNMFFTGLCFSSVEHMRCSNTKDLLKE